jgi:hypothetical protein
MAIALWGVTMVLLVACATAAPPASREFEDRGTLSVGRERRGEQLVLDSRRGASYRITGLRPGAAYEARLSYPATVPPFLVVPQQNRSLLLQPEGSSTLSTTP